MTSRWFARRSSCPFSLIVFGRFQNKLHAIRYIYTMLKQWNLASNLSQVRKTSDTFCATIKPSWTRNLGVQVAKSDECKSLVQLKSKFPFIAASRGRNLIQQKMTYSAGKWERQSQESYYNGLVWPFLHRLSGAAKAYRSCFKSRLKIKLQQLGVGTNRPL